VIPFAPRNSTSGRTFGFEPFNLLSTSLKEGSSVRKLCNTFWLPICFNSLLVIVVDAPVANSLFRRKIPVTTTSSKFSVCSFKTTTKSFWPCRTSLSLISPIFTIWVSIPTKRKTRITFFISAGKEREYFPSISVAHPIVVPSIKIVTPGKGIPSRSFTIPLITCCFLFTLSRATITSSLITTTSFIIVNVNPVPLNIFLSALSRTSFLIFTTFFCSFLTFSTL